MATVSLSPDQIAEQAERFERLPAEDLLAWAVETFSPRIVLTCSWQQQSSVLCDMLWRGGLLDRVRVVELDTGLLFPETYATRDRLTERYSLRVERVDPLRTVDEQAAHEGPELWRREPDRCCALRKVEPLERALQGADAWITGIRRAQSATRADARTLQVDERRGVVKVQPLVAWDDERVRGYLYAHDVPVNPLHDRGYPSIGCVPCTRAVAPGDDPRSGRWAGFDKTECGLHR